jgi:type IVB pilus formation R64 PilN family outer membrane protein
MKVKYIAGLIGSLSAASLLSGCAAVSHEQVDAKYDAVKKQYSDVSSAQEIKPEPLVKKVKGSYLTSTPIALSYDATLPPVFRDVTMMFPGKINLATAAARIYAATKIPVRIREDVYYGPRSLASGSVTMPSSSSNGLSLPAPLPGDTQGVKALTNFSGIASQKSEDMDMVVDMEFQGSLSRYLDLVCNRLGVNWEYRDGTVYIYRMMTKTFQVKVNPGSIEFSSALSKGGQTATGATGGSGGGGGSSGSFASTSSTSMQGKFSVWESLEAAIKGVKTPSGTVTIVQSSGNVIVTDTKEAVNEIGKLIEAQNAVLSRQVQVDVRIVKFSLNNTSTAGLNLNVAYSKLNSLGVTEGIFGAYSPGSLSAASALLPGGFGAQVVSPTSKFNGSSVFVEALNQVGKVVSDQTVSAITTNRVPVPIGKFSTVTYLAETTPATGGAAGGSPGLPGLTPGQVTTGFFLNVIPTVLENNSVLMRMSIDESSLTKMGSITVGSGATEQMIQTPNTDGNKSDHSIGLREGESLVLMGVSKDQENYDKAYAVTGVSNSAGSVKEMQAIIITPRVRPGI